jgi:hypothetical protein
MKRADAGYVTPALLNPECALEAKDLEALFGVVIAEGDPHLGCLLAAHPKLSRSAAERLVRARPGLDALLALVGNAAAMQHRSVQELIVGVRSTAVLSAFLEQSEDADLRRSAMRKLLRMSPKRVLAALIDGSMSPPVSGLIGRDDLAHALAHKDATVRMLAIQALPHLEPASPAPVKPASPAPVEPASREGDERATSVRAR